MGRALETPVPHLEEWGQDSQDGGELESESSGEDDDPHHGGGALDDLPGLALLVDLTEAGPLPQLHVGVNLGNKESK